MSGILSTAMGKATVFCLGLFTATMAVSATQAADEPTLVLHGAVTGRDNHTYREVTFDVPEGTARITVVFAYTGREARTTIDLGLLGPDGMRGQDGFRGWSGGNKSVLTVSAVDATPSYMPGPIRPGRWALLLGFPNVRAETKAEFTANIYL